MLNVKVQCSKWECLLCNRSFTSKFCYVLHCKNVHKEEKRQPLVEFDGRPFYGTNERQEQPEKDSLNNEGSNVQQGESTVAAEEDESVQKDNGQLHTCLVCKKSFTKVARLVSHQRLHLSKQKAKRVKDRQNCQISADKVIAKSLNKKVQQEKPEVDIGDQVLPDASKTNKDDHIYVVGSSDLNGEHAGLQKPLNMNIVIRLAEDKVIQHGKGGLCISTGDQNPEVAITSSAYVKTFPLSRKRGRPKKEQSEGMEEAAGTEFEEQLVEQTLVFPEVPAEVRSGKKRSGARKKSRECDVCNKVFANRSSLREHQRMHSGEKPYICSICDKGFIRMGHLRQHMCSHTGLWPFKCGACGKGFMNPSRVTRHMRVHNDERPCVCDQCGETFKEPHHLSRHMHLHSGLKPFKCPICEDRYFIQAGNLKIHMKTHEREMADSKITICDVSHEVSLTSTNQSADEELSGATEESETAIEELLISSDGKCDAKDGESSDPNSKEASIETGKAAANEDGDLMPNLVRTNEKTNEPNETAVESSGEVLDPGSSELAQNLVGSQIVLQIVQSEDQDFQVQGFQALTSLDPELLRQLATSVAQEMQSQS
eukprot:gene17390-8988_t